MSVPGGEKETMKQRRKRIWEMGDGRKYIQGTKQGEGVVNLRLCSLR